jgi:hypothetical protein
MNMTSQNLKKPVYKRQQFLLSFIKELNEPCTVIEFQKLLFLYLTWNNLPYYEFIPYLYGSFSIQAGEDINTLQTMGWIDNSKEKIYYTGIHEPDSIILPFRGIGEPILDQLPKVRGKELTKLVYEQYPYYAINSKIAESLMDRNGMDRIKAEKKRLKQSDSMLFTIGYEGVSLEKYLNILIQNDIHLLCDVRNNPISRKFGFSKNNLQKYLTHINIDYIHIPELGIISEKRSNLHSDLDYDKLFKDYKSSLSKRGETLNRVYQLLQTKTRIALTCFEHDPSHCHRHVIRDFMRKTYNVNTMDL